MPKVYNRHRKDEPEGAVYIGRPSKWGNPFRIGKDGTRTHVYAKYVNWVRARLNDPRDTFAEDVVRELGGKDLVCWCAPQGCHGDILLDIARMGRKKWLHGTDSIEVHNVPSR